MTCERKQAVVNFAEIEWERLVGRPGAYLPRPDRPPDLFGIDVSPIVAQDVDVLRRDDGSESQSGAATEPRNSQKSPKRALKESRWHARAARQWLRVAER